MLEDRMATSQRERDVLKAMAPVLKSQRTQGGAAAETQRPPGPPDSATLGGSGRWGCGASPPRPGVESASRSGLTPAGVGGLSASAPADASPRRHPQPSDHTHRGQRLHRALPERRISGAPPSLAGPARRQSPDRRTGRRHAPNSLPATLSALPAPRPAACGGLGGRCHPNPPEFNASRPPGSLPVEQTGKTGPHPLRGAALCRKGHRPALGSHPRVALSSERHP